MKEYRWAVLGCGSIANEFAQAMEFQGREIYSVANRTHEKAKTFAEKYHIKKVYDQIDDIFEDENVDIVYIATPHNSHITYLKKALQHGKHVLCEKAITLNSSELEEAIALAQEKKLILAEAMTIYHMPVYRELEKIIASGNLGALRLMQVNFGSFKEYDMTNRFFNRDLAGGALLDIGVYAISFARAFLSEKPEQILSQVKMAPTGVDAQAGILLMNARQEVATITLSLHAKQPKRGTVVFENGYIEMYDYPRGQQAVINYTESQEKVVIEAGETRKALVYEIEDMENAVAGEGNVMHLDYTIDVMEIMTKLRNDWKMTYPEED